MSYDGCSLAGFMAAFTIDARGIRKIDKHEVGTWSVVDRFPVIQGGHRSSPKCSQRVVVGDNNVSIGVKLRATSAAAWKFR